MFRGTNNDFAQGRLLLEDGEMCEGKEIQWLIDTQSIISNNGKAAREEVILRSEIYLQWRLCPPSHHY